MNPDVIAMSQKELQRLPVIESTLARRLSQMEAARCLALSTRQVRRLQGRLKAEGPPGLAHRNRGRPSHNRLPERTRQRALKLVQERYSDFGPTLACEKLAEIHRIRVSDETLRRWMRSEGWMNGRRRLRPHRQWRERSAAVGQMVQLDGSHHDWLEGRGPQLVLMGYIDDATGRAWGRFYPSEDLAAAFDSFKRYIRLYGIPQSVYCDKHPMYRSPKEPTVEEQLQGKDPQSQFERALSQLGVRVLHANSPQAKGRIERLFKTLQDRLVKEMRLSGVRTLEEANRFLKGFLARHNRRFARPARESGNLHRLEYPGLRLDRILCIQEPRVVANDGTIQIQGKRLQLLPPGLRPLAKKGVIVTISAQGRLRVFQEGQALDYRPIPPEPRPKPSRIDLPRGGHRLSTPATDHPWRHFKKMDRRQKIQLLQRLQQLQSLKALKLKNRTF